MNIDPKMASILIVDDEPANVRLIEKILMTVGYTNVMGIQNAQEVLPLYQEHGCDLILLDIDMPELDGFGVMEQLNIFTDGDIPPVLILTAQHMQSFRQRAFDLGARDYVTKPFDTGELLSRVRNLLEAQMAQKYMRHQNEILEKKVLARTNELQDTRLQVVRRLGRAAEYRDNETGLHIIRMSTIASLLGEGTGMSSYDNDLLLNAASMHDIGKIGIPDHILLKQGKLSPEEWEVMKTHTQIGADILSGDDSDLMIMAHDVALTHHEKWNGEGYPKRLEGEDIPLVGRITALADVFDALTSARPYKEPWTLERAVELISSERGHHFDPDLVDLFMEKLPEIREINETYVEPEPSLENNKAWG